MVVAADLVAIGNGSHGVDGVAGKDGKPGRREGEDGHRGRSATEASRGDCGATMDLRLWIEWSNSAGCPMACARVTLQSEGGSRRSDEQLETQRVPLSALRHVIIEARGGDGGNGAKGGNGGSGAEGGSTMQKGGNGGRGGLGSSGASGGRGGHVTVQCSRTDAMLLSKLQGELSSLVRGGRGGQAGKNGSDGTKGRDAPFKPTTSAGEAARRHDDKSGTAIVTVERGRGSRGGVVPSRRRGSRDVDCDCHSHDGSDSYDSYDSVDSDDAGDDNRRRVPQPRPYGRDRPRRTARRRTEVRQRRRDHTLSNGEDGRQGVLQFIVDGERYSSLFEVDLVVCSLQLEAQNGFQYGVVEPLSVHSVGGFVCANRGRMPSPEGIAVRVQGNGDTVHRAPDTPTLAVTEAGSRLAPNFNGRLDVANLSVLFCRPAGWTPSAQPLRCSVNVPVECVQVAPSSSLGREDSNEALDDSFVHVYGTKMLNVVVSDPVSIESIQGSMALSGTEHGRVRVQVTNRTSVALGSASVSGRGLFLQILVPHIVDKERSDGEGADGADGEGVAPRLELYDRRGQELKLKVVSWIELAAVSRRFNARSPLVTCVEAAQIAGAGHGDGNRQFLECLFHIPELGPHATTSWSAVIAPGRHTPAFGSGKITANLYVRGLQPSSPLVHVQGVDYEVKFTDGHTGGVPDVLFVVHATMTEDCARYIVDAMRDAGLECAFICAATRGMVTCESIMSVLMGVTYPERTVLNGDNTREDESETGSWESDASDSAAGEAESDDEGVDLDALGVASDAVGLLQGKTVVLVNGCSSVYPGSEKYHVDCLIRGQDVRLLRNMGCNMVVLEDTTESSDVEEVKRHTRRGRWYSHMLAGYYSARELNPYDTTIPAMQAFDSVEDFKKKLAANEARGQVLSPWNESPPCGMDTSSVSVYSIKAKMTRVGVLGAPSKDLCKKKSAAIAETVGELLATYHPVALYRCAWRSRVKSEQK